MSFGQLPEHLPSCRKRNALRGAIEQSAAIQMLLQSLDRAAYRRLSDAQCFRGLPKTAEPAHSKKCMQFDERWGVELH